MADYSIGEFESLVFKAYRGCGFSWGLAQEAGVSAATLAVCGLHPARAFAQLLPMIDGYPSGKLAPHINDESRWAVGDREFHCPVITGTVLSDFGIGAYSNGESLTIEQVLQPTILLPFLCHSVRTVEVAADSATYHCGNGMIRVVSIDDPHRPVGREVNIRPVQGSVKNSPQRQRVDVDEGSLEVLLRFAHRTYVPASESSRAGAGAGLLDND